MGRIYFVSALNVGDHVYGGASILSLAYLQAVSAVAPGRVTLVGPLALERAPLLPPGIDDVIRIPERGPITKLAWLAAGKSVDRLSPFVDRLINRLDLSGALFFFNGSSGGRLVYALRRRGVPSITLFHNVEERFWAYTEHNPLMRAMRCRTAAINDRLAFAHSAASILLSPDDAAIMRGQARQQVPGGVVLDDGYFAPRPAAGDSVVPPPAGTADLLVNCSLGLPQNQPGLEAFIRRCWARYACTSALAESRLVLAGANPSAHLMDLASRYPRIEVVANPSDGRMESLFARCFACVSTIDGGSGIKVRVAEALRRGRPVIATPHSCIGYERIDPRILRRASIDEMGTALAAIVADWRGGTDLASQARREFDRVLSFDAGALRVGELVRSLYR